MILELYILMKLYIDKKCQWLHAASKYKYTYYQAHEERGQKAIDEIYFT